jgi:hypothetical protein
VSAGQERGRLNVIHVFAQQLHVQRRGHDDKIQVGPVLLLQVECAGQRDVAVKMAFVKFVEDEDRNTAQHWVVNHLPEQNTFRYKPDFRLGRRDIFEADLVADLVSELDAEFLRHTRREQPCGQPARLENHDLPIAEQSMSEQHLRDLRGFAGTGRRGQDQPPAGFQPGYEVALDFINGQTISHVPQS